MPPLSSIARQDSWFNLEIALRSLGHRIGRRRNIVNNASGTVTHIFLCVVDHYEPQVGHPPRHLAQERVLDWLRRYPIIADAHRDADGRTPPHSFFYPWDEYDCWELARIAEMCADGYGEVDIHLHHSDDTEDSLRRKFREAIQVYQDHGLLSRWPDGRPAWGFIHGNWALANSRCDRGVNYCGVNNEIAILQEEGCYADFTFPAWKYTAQPRQMNSIYYAQADAIQPKSYDMGCSAKVGASQVQGLLLIAGPLVPFVEKINGRRMRIAMDDSDLSASRRYHAARMDRWVNAGISVQGRPDRIFIKLHSHGAEDTNRACMLGEDLNALFTDAEARYNDGIRYCLHYVTAREMFNVVKATEAGIEDVEIARNLIIPPPAYCRILLETSDADALQVH